MNADQIILGTSIQLKDNRASLPHSNKRHLLMKTRPYFKNGKLKRKSDQTGSAFQSPILIAI